MNKIQKIKKATFNSGFLTVIMGVDENKKILHSSIPYGLNTVTENRFNAALASGERIDKVIQIPLNPDSEKRELPHNAYIEINDNLYTIWKQQPILTTNPPINVLTLKEYN